MDRVISSIGSTATAFIRDEEGAQVVEYALIIALVSIALAVVLAGATDDGLQGAFATLVTRVSACFGVTGCPAT